MGKFTNEFCKYLAKEYLDTQHTTINKIDIERWLNSELWEDHTIMDVEDIMLAARQIINNKISLSD
jgi:hypothetical protein